MKCPKCGGFVVRATHHYGYGIPAVRCQLCGEFGHSPLELREKYGIWKGMSKYEFQRRKRKAS